MKRRSGGFISLMASCEQVERTGFFSIHE